MIALKKPPATKCSNRRTVSLIAHTAKIVATILRSRIQSKIESVLGEDQFGFRRGKERTLEIDAELCVCCIDWQKAFDQINADFKSNWY
jgi:hypothetical protein